MVNIDHIEPHLFGEQGIVFRKLLHLAYEGSGKSFHLVAFFFFIIQILNGYDYGICIVDGFANLKAFLSGYKNIEPAIGQIYLTHDFCSTAYLVQVLGLRVFYIVFKKGKPYKAVAGIGIFD